MRLIAILHHHSHMPCIENRDLQNKQVERRIGTTGDKALVTLDIVRLQGTA
jgi:galactitol-specific phosphotransferase system IIC component